MRLLTSNKFNKRSITLPQGFDRGAIIEIKPAAAVRVLDEVFGWGHHSHDLQADLDNAYSSGLVPWQMLVA